MQNVSSIRLMYAKGTSKAKNDEENKIREKILIDLHNNTNPQFLEDPTYGTQWKDLKEKWTSLLTSISPVQTYQHIEIEQKAGRNHTYDFRVRYSDKDNQTYEKNVEFKHNVKTISDMPQFLSLPVKSSLEMMRGQSYSTFYYGGGYLDEYMRKICQDVRIEKPQEDVYQKHIQSVKTNVHAFFDTLKQECENKELEKAEIVDRSIREFLEKYGKHIDLEWLTKKFKDSQMDKIFVMWDCSEFHVESFGEDDLTLIPDQEPAVTKNSIVVQSKTKAFHLLLRWRNRKGILNPAWQISMKPISGGDAQKTCNVCNKPCKVKKSGELYKHMCLT